MGHHCGYQYIHFEVPEEAGEERLFKEKNDRNVPNLEREMSIHIHAAQIPPNILDIKRSSKKTIIITLSEVKEFWKQRQKSDLPHTREPLQHNQQISQQKPCRPRKQNDIYIHSAERNCQPILPAKLSFIPIETQAGDHNYWTALQEMLKGVI